MKPGFLVLLAFYNETIGKLAFTALARKCFCNFYVHHFHSTSAYSSSSKLTPDQLHQ